MFLSCRSVSAQLTDGKHAHGPPLTRVGIRLHLTFCKDCTRYLVQMRAVRAALGALRTAEVAAETKARLGEQFRTWHAGLGKLEREGA
jgi:hypothetical protein